MQVQKEVWSAGQIEVSTELQIDGDSGQFIRRTTSIDVALNETQWTGLAKICEKTPLTLFIERGIRIDTTMHR